MKPIDVKDKTYINIDKKVKYKDPKFKVANHVRISKYKNIFAKGYTSNWSEDLNDLNGKTIIGTFYEKELQRQINNNLQ